MEKTLKILSVGNSFSVDTMEYLPEIAAELGIDAVFGNLYIGGCSINRHFANITSGEGAYKYFRSDGGAWSAEPGWSIADAVRSEAWDFISIQHGSGDGSYYTDPASYANLASLAAQLRALAAPGVKIAFNMTWVGDIGCTRPEFHAFGGDQMRLWAAIAQRTAETVMTLDEIDCLSSAGTAIQNLRTAVGRPLTRDSYHLSKDLGRYTAALTFLHALSGADISCVRYMPEGVSEEERPLCIAAAEAACRSPFCVTSLR